MQLGAGLSRARRGCSSWATAKCGARSEHPHGASGAEASPGARMEQQGLLAPVPALFCPFSHMGYGIPWLQRESAWSNAAACYQLPVQERAHTEHWQAGYPALPSHSQNVTSRWMKDGAGFVPKLFDTSRGSDTYWKSDLLITDGL